MSMATSACAWLRICALVVTHGPTPVLLCRVITTWAPAASRSARRAVATSKLKLASVNPEAVSVPVVSHVSDSRPFQISWLMNPASEKLPPLWPGSMPMTRPASGRAGGLGLGEVAEVPGEDGNPAGTTALDAAPGAPLPPAGGSAGRAAALQPQARAAARTAAATESFGCIGSTLFGPVPVLRQ